MQIIYSIKAAHPAINVRMSFIGYDDVGKANNLQCVDLTYEHMKLLQYINAV